MKMLIMAILANFVVSAAFAEQYSCTSDATGMKRLEIETGPNVVVIHKVRFISTGLTSVGKKGTPSTKNLLTICKNKKNVAALVTPGFIAVSSENYPVTGILEYLGVSYDCHQVGRPKIK